MSLTTFKYCSYCVCNAIHDYQVNVFIANSRVVALVPYRYVYFLLILQEEVMTLERILLQTIKFDLMVEHPYAFLLKYAKLVKGNVMVQGVMLP
jgi:hypothetical protein